MICPNRKAFYERFRGSPASAPNAGPEQKECIHNGQCDKRTDHQDKQGIKERTCRHVSRRERDPQAFVRFGDGRGVAVVSRTSMRRGYGVASVRVCGKLWRAA